MLKISRHFPFQVVVTVNDIPSSCRGNACGYSYSQSQTPVIISIRPEEYAYDATSNSEVTIACSGCSNYTKDLTVTIGDADCDVTSVTAGGNVVCNIGKLFNSFL